MGFKNAKVYQEEKSTLWTVEMTYYGFLWGENKIKHEFETYELALTFIARERCRGEIELPRIEE